MNKDLISFCAVLLVVIFLIACGRSGGNRVNGNSDQPGSNAPPNFVNTNSANNSNSAQPNSGPLNANTSNANTEIVITPQDEKAALLQMEDAWNEAYIKRDEGWFQRNLADDYTEIGDSGKTINDKAGATAAMMADKSTEIVAELSDTNVRIEANAAVVTGVNHVTLKDEKGKRQDYKHRFTDTYIKRDGRWLIWANESTRMP